LIVVTLTVMKPTPTSISSSDIQSLLSDFDASGQDAASFARARGIAVWRLRYALDRRAGKPRRQTAAKRRRPSMFIPAQLVDRAPPSAPPSTPSSLELLLAGGHRLRISTDFDPEHLRRVVEALSKC
jgi:hypothetical protein